MRPAPAIKELRLTIEPASYAVGVAKRSSDMDAFVGNLRMSLQQSQRLIEAYGIGGNIGKVGNRRERQESVG